MLYQVCRDVETVIQKPTLSSNMSMVWHCLRLLNIDSDLGSQYGSLFSTQLSD